MVVVLKLTVTLLSPITQLLSKAFEGRYYGNSDVISNARYNIFLGTFEWQYNITIKFFTSSWILLLTWRSTTSMMIIFSRMNIETTKDSVTSIRVMTQKPLFWGKLSTTSHHIWTSSVRGDHNYFSSLSHVKFWGHNSGCQQLLQNNLQTDVK